GVRGGRAGGRRVEGRPPFSIEGWTPGSPPVVIRNRPVALSRATWGTGPDMSVNARAGVAGRASPTPRPASTRAPAPSTSASLIGRLPAFAIVWPSLKLPVHREAFGVPQV